MVYWNEDAVYALSSYKTLAWFVGTWPIEDDTLYSKLRWLFAIVSEVTGGEHLSIFYVLL